LAWIGLGVAMPLAAQQRAAAGTIELFFDCQGNGCYDLDFYRREIPWVNWVRDRESSDVHVLVTTQRTGGGGLESTLSFIGRRNFEGQDQVLLVHTAGDATEDEIRTAQVVRLKLGLARYLAATPMAERLKITQEGPPGAAGHDIKGPVHDPWDSWVFRINANGNLNDESSYSSRSLNTSVSANRITEAWKLTLSGRYSDRSETYDLSGGEYTSDWVDWNTNFLVAKSLDDHFSAGIRGGAGRSTSLNEDSRWNLAPVVEFDVFPYAESSRRALTLQAFVDVRHWNYDEETIFFRTSETRSAAGLVGSLSFNQPWGQASVSLLHSRYFYDPEKYQASIGGYSEFRVFKGFSVNVFGSYSRIRDQLYLSAAGATDEEILVQQRQLETDHRFRMSFGVTYRFGSIFNNVVNPRLAERGFFF